MGNDGNGNRYDPIEAAYDSAAKSLYRSVDTASKAADKPPCRAESVITQNYSRFIQQGFYEGQLPPSACLVSPNGRYQLVQLIDESSVSSLPLLEFVPTTGVRPRSLSLPYGLPGDNYLPEASLLICDVLSNKQVVADRPALAASNGAFVETGRVFWGADNQLYVIEQSRDRCSMIFVQIDPASGKGRVLLEERGETYLQPGPLPFSEPQVLVLPGANIFVWYSQKSGWGHLYCHDLTTGECLNPITAGDYVVTKLHQVDGETGVVYFSACGKESQCNPYFEKLYRVNLDGSDCKLLTPEDAQHDIQSINGESERFVDRFSRIDLPTHECVRSLSNGSIFESFIDKPAAKVTARDFNHPIGFAAKAKDLETDLYGVMYRPPNLDIDKRYPVILAIYGTPHECIVPKRYAETSDKVRDVYRSLAQLGFIVVMLDPRGTPLRGKSFHDVAYKNLQNGGGIDDQVYVLEQLGERYRWMDMERVGITGHSGGGYASARAMLTHPDLFKVCVSSAGNHDQRLYVAGWAETFQGLVEGDNYDVFSYDHLIPNLKGKLLLIHGDADANVHIAHTMQLVDKLISHNKDFDLLILPNRGHLHGQDSYFIRKLWDYFVEHLLGEEPPKEYTITR